MYLPKLACGVAFAAFAAAAPGLAQEAPTDAAPAAAEGEIIVTAQKRAQSLQDVGITISAFSGEDLSVAGVSDAVGLATITPALSLAGSYSGQRPDLRHSRRDPAGFLRTLGGANGDLRRLTPIWRITMRPVSAYSISSASRS